MAIGTFTLLKRPSLAPFDLHETDKHGYIEHNASITRDDTPSGKKFAPQEIDHARLHEFLNMAHITSTSNGERVLTAEDIAERRIELEDKCPPLAPLYAELGRAEFAMLLEIFGFGKDHAVSQSDAQILEEEKFPEGWTPTHTLHLWDAMTKSSEVRKIMTQRRAEKAPTSPAGEEKHAHVVRFCKESVEWMLHGHAEQA